MNQQIVCPECDFIASHMWDDFEVAKYRYHHPGREPCYVPRPAAIIDPLPKESTGEPNDNRD